MSIKPRILRLALEALDSEMADIEERKVRLEAFCNDARRNDETVDFTECICHMWVCGDDRDFCINLRAEKRKLARLREYLEETLKLHFVEIDVAAIWVRLMRYSPAQYSESFVATSPDHGVIIIYED